MEGGIVEILTSLQQRVLDVLFGVEEIRRHFYLTGGTALAAFYLQHRYSDDLDLFTHDFDIADVEHVIEDALCNAKIKLERERGSPTFRRYRVGGSLQVDLARDIEYRVGSPQLINGIMVDTKKNIAVNKVTTIYGRLEPKDYVDLYFLLKDDAFDIMELFSLGKNKDGGLEPFQWAKIIADVDTFSVLPRMVVPLKLKDLQTFFHHLRDQIIDALKPKQR